MKDQITKHQITDFKRIILDTLYNKRKLVKPVTYNRVLMNLDLRFLEALELENNPDYADYGKLLKWAQEMCTLSLIEDGLEKEKSFNRYLLDNPHIHGKPQSAAEVLGTQGSGVVINIVQDSNDGYDSGDFM